MSITSRCFEYLPNTKIRKAQEEVINEKSTIFYGPDTDKYNESFRYDGCHFNEKGGNAIAIDWAKRIDYALSNTNM